MVALKEKVTYRDLWTQLYNTAEPRAVRQRTYLKQKILPYQQSKFPQIIRHIRGVLMWSRFPTIEARNWGGRIHIQNDASSVNLIKKKNTNRTGKAQTIRKNRQMVYEISYFPILL